jgi:hypothetical protein
MILKRPTASAPEPVATEYRSARVDEALGTTIVSTESALPRRS